MAQVDKVILVEGEVDDTRQLVDESTFNATESSEFITAKEVPSGGTQDPSGCAWVPSDPAPSSSEYFSTRIQAMMERQREGESSVESEIEASRVHWSELQPRQGAERGSVEANRAVFRSLQQQYPNFFEDWNEAVVEVGEKIAEGAQAAIHRVRWIRPEDAHRNDKAVVKVFKMEGVSLEDLQQQWPLGMLLKPSTSQHGSYVNSGSSVGGGYMLKDGSFVFVMVRHWGDLRKLIDLRMQHNSNQAPPFTIEKALEIMDWIAKGMRGLHVDNIVHRDLKASNVLILPLDESPFLNFNPISDDNFIVAIADYECSVGVVGTRFWRAPEILNGIKNCKVQPSLFNEKSDVYSYAMTCYEVLTGKIPFEDIKPNDYDVVLGGARPILPNGIELWVQSLLNNCWHEDPSMRPSFQEIVSIFKS